MVQKKYDSWMIITFVILAFFVIFFAIPILQLLKVAVFDGDGNFTLANFQKFFSNEYYYGTIFNSFKITIVVTVVSLILGIALSYFYSFYHIKGAKLILILSILCSMSAPFIGAYSWILLLGRSGMLTKFLKSALGIHIGSIYGFGGIVLVQALKFFPLVFIYMNAIFSNMDQSLLEASHNLGCSGYKRFWNVTLKLSMPTVLASALLVFMRSFADFGTPLLMGEGYRTFPVEIYSQFLSENGSDYGFASAISIIAIVLTATIFYLQKYLVNRYRFTINSLHPVSKQDLKGIKSFLVHLYSYSLVLIAFLPQVYIIYVSFRNYRNSVLAPGFSLKNYQDAIFKQLWKSMFNTTFMSLVALSAIIIIAVLIAYLVVRRSNPFNQLIDTLSMLPYIMPGSVIGIALVISFSEGPLVLTGTMTIMIIALIIRRLPFTVRSATATLMQIPMNIEEASRSLGASKRRTFFKITIPMMSKGIISGAILSWVSIITEVSSAVILYNNSTITLTMSTYTSILRGTYGTAAAFATVTTIFTILSLMIYMRVNKQHDGVM